MADLSGRQKAVVAIAVVVFLLFVGTNIYPILCPTHWMVRCPETDSLGRLLPTENYYFEEARQVEVHVSEAQKRGAVCTVNPVKACVWNDW